MPFSNLRLDTLYRPGLLQNNLRRFARTRLHGIRITPLPEGVQVDFRATLADRVEISLVRARSDDFVRDRQAAGGHVALRIARPERGNRYTERLENGGFFRIEQGTDYWIELSCDDVDGEGKRYGKLRMRSRFRTSVRSLVVLVEKIFVDDDSDSYGFGEITFHYGKYDLTTGRLVERRETAEQSLSSGGLPLQMPFNPRFYEGDWKPAPRRAAVFIGGVDDDHEPFPHFGEGISLHSARPVETFRYHDRHRDYGNDADYDWSWVCRQFELRSLVGEDHWTEELISHPSGRLRFRAIVTLKCTVQAQPQPAGATTWLVEADDASHPDRSGKTASTAGMAPPAPDPQRTRLRTAAGAVLDLQVSVDGHALIRRLDTDADPFADSVPHLDLGRRLRAVMSFPPANASTVSPLFAIDDSGTLLQGRIDEVAGGIDWRTAAEGMKATSALPLIDGADNAWLLIDQRGGVSLLTADGQYRPLPDAPSGADRRFVGCRWQNEWLLFARPDPDAAWTCLAGSERRSIPETLPRTLGEPVQVAADPNGAIVVYGIDVRRRLQAWFPASNRMEDLGQFDAIVDALAAESASSTEDSAPAADQPAARPASPAANPRSEAVTA